MIPGDNPAQITKPVRGRRRKASKRSFKQYIESDNLWMSSTLGDLAIILQSTRQHMKSLKTMEEQLVAAQNFIKDCGAKEKKITERLERST